MSKHHNGPRRYDRNVRVAMARKQLQQTFTQEDLYDILNALTRYPGVTRIDISKLPERSQQYVSGLRLALNGLVQMSSLLKGLITDAYLRERISMDRMLNECLVHNDLSWAKIDLRLPDDAPAADKRQATSILVGFHESARGQNFSVIADPKVFPNLVGWDIDVQLNSEEEIKRRKLKKNQVATFRGRKLMDYEAINDYEKNPQKFIYEYRLIRAGRVAQEFGHHLYGALQGAPKSTEAFTRRFLEYARDIDGLFASTDLAANVDEVAATVSEAMAAFRSVKDIGLGMDHEKVVKAVRSSVKTTELQSPVVHEVPEVATAKPLPHDTVFGPEDQGLFEVVCDVVNAAEKRPGPQEVAVHGREFHVVGHALDAEEQIIAFQVWSKDLNLVQMTWEPSADAKANAEAAWQGFTSEEGFFSMLDGMEAGVHDFGADGFPLELEIRYRDAGEEVAQDIWLHVDGERVHMITRFMESRPEEATEQGDSLLDAVHDVEAEASESVPDAAPQQTADEPSEVDNRA